VKSPTQYGTLSDAELREELCLLTQDLVNGRRDHADLAAAINRDFFQTFLDAEGESVAGRNRLAEAATATLEQERIATEANIACISDLCALIRTLLDRRE
jgi:hypothetical protein